MTTTKIRSLASITFLALLTASLSGVAGEGSHVGNGAPKSQKISIAEKLEGKEMKLDVALDPAAKTVVVTNAGGAMPAFLEVKVKTKDGKSTAVTMQADKAPSPTKFTGKIDAWDSFTGVELRYSADNKQWNTVNKTL